MKVDETTGHDKNTQGALRSIGDNRKPQESVGNHRQTSRKHRGAQESIGIHRKAQEGTGKIRIPYKVQNKIGHILTYETNRKLKESQRKHTNSVKVQGVRLKAQEWVGSHRELQESTTKHRKDHRKACDSIRHAHQILRHVFDHFRHAYLDTFRHAVFQTRQILRHAVYYKTLTQRPRI